MPEALNYAQFKALLPVLALITWTLVVWLWVMLTRIPTMQREKIHPQKGKYTDQLADLLPEKVRNVSDNYNHLHEQPTLFYALAFFLALGGGYDNVNVALLWGYVIIRIMHSFIQATINIVVYRFYAFVASSICLFVIVIRELIRIFLI
ncbi:MAG: hypothetical protein CMK07_14900 [Ponticaulis sp.]|nr:hypothetical protein [Ponticaulis sp.]